jgi:hypothetical protein
LALSLEANMSDDAATAAGGPLPAVAVAPPSEPQQASGGGGLLAVIERLATNPNLNQDAFALVIKTRREEEDRAAERAFYAALAEAKGEFAPIIKTRLVDFAHKDGRGRTQYKYEELADIAAIVDPVLSKHGIVYFHRTEQQGQGKVRVFCTLAHADGFTKTNSLDGVEDNSGQKNANQMVTSTVTFLQRSTLKQALGIAAGRDDDNRSLGASPTITVDQANDLERLLEETGRSPTMLLKLVGAESIAAMTVDQWTRAGEYLGVIKAEKQRRKQNAPAGND